MLLFDRVSCLMKLSAAISRKTPQAKLALKRFVDLMGSQVNPQVWLFSKGLATVRNRALVRLCAPMEMEMCIESGLPRKTLATVRIRADEGEGLLMSYAVSPQAFLRFETLQAAFNRTKERSVLVL